MKGLNLKYGNCKKSIYNRQRDCRRLQYIYIKAYELIREMNKEIEAMGKITLKGKINRHFYEQKINPTD